MFSIKMPDTSKLFDGLDERSLTKVRVRSQNALAAKAKTLANRTAREEFYVKAETLRNTMSIERASADSPIAELVISGPRLPLSKFRISPAKMNPKQQRRILGTRVTISRTSGRKEWKGTFTAEMKSGHIGVFRRSVKGMMRANAKRSAIIEQYGISAADMVNSKAVGDQVRQLVHDESQIIYERELAYATSTASAVVKL